MRYPKWLLEINGISPSISSLFKPVIFAIRATLMPSASIALASSSLPMAPCTRGIFAIDVEYGPPAESRLSMRLLVYYRNLLKQKDEQALALLALLRKCFFEKRGIF
jgi:hypothetical protein